MVPNETGEITPVLHVTPSLAYMASREPFGEPMGFVDWPESYNSKIYGLSPMCKSAFILIPFSVFLLPILIIYRVFIRPRKEEYSSSSSNYDSYDYLSSSEDTSDGSIEETEDEEQEEDEEEKRQGVLRTPGDCFYDSAGILRSPDENYYDGNGVLRSPGEDFFDGQGVLRSPGKDYFDGDGVLRSPDEWYYDGGSK